ncbi:MAG TPA: hypothetical protein VH639_28680 [Bryobacteraceae bacterium]|jgi:hypothetical protein
MTAFLQIGPGCGGTYWNNSNIGISTGNLNVAQPTTISVRVTNNSSTETVRVNGVQASVCALNTLTGFNSASILPSLSGPNLNLLEFDNVFPFPGDVVIPPNGQQIISLPQWTPASNDIHHFDNVPGAQFDLPQKLTLHACVFANCFGSWPPQSGGQVNDDGQFFNWNSISNAFCGDTHHAQHNTTLHRLANQLGLIVPFYAGATGEGRLIPLKLTVAEVPQTGGIDPLILEKIRLAGLGGLPIAPATAPAKVAGVAEFRGVAERIRHVFEELGDEIREGFEHLRGNLGFEDDETDDPSPQAVREVRVVPNEVHPLLLKADFVGNEPIGIVHIFDVTQEDPSGARGGFRLATVLAPD